MTIPIPEFPKASSANISNNNVDVTISIRVLIHQLLYVQKKSFTVQKTTSSQHSDNTNPVRSDFFDLIFLFGDHVFIWHALSSLKLHRPFTFTNSYTTHNKKWPHTQKKAFQYHFWTSRIDHMGYFIGKKHSKQLTSLKEICEYYFCDCFFLI